MSELKNITMIFNGKPSDESIDQFLHVVNEIAQKIEMKESKNNKDNLRETSNQAKQKEDNE